VVGVDRQACYIEPMTDVADSANDALDRAGMSRINTVVAISVALTATFTALCNVKDGNICQAMAQEQAGAIDAWAYYQAKGTKQNVAQAALDQLQLQLDLNEQWPAPARALMRQKLAEYTRAIAHYEAEKNEIRDTAQQHQHTYDQLNYHDDQFDMAEALMSIAIALFGVTALTQKRSLLLAALAFAATGALLGVAGFVGLHIHPKFLADLLS
jgi:hypothetical protein